MLLCLQEKSEAESQELRNLWNELFLPTADAEPNYQKLAELIRLNVVEPLVLNNVRMLKLSIGHPLESILEAKAQEIRTQNQLRLISGKPVFSKLHDQGIPFIILKGQVLGPLVFADPGYKKMNDIDFLIRRQDLSALAKIYQELGFQSIAELHVEGHQADEKYSHHWPPYVSPDLNCVMGTHWNLVSPLSGIQMTEDDLWNNPVPFEYMGLPAFRLNNENLLIHLLVHLGHYKTGLKELADIFNFIRWGKNSWSWELISTKLQQANSIPRAYYSLSLVNKLDPSLNLETLLAAWEKLVPRKLVQETAAKTGELYFVVRSRSTHISRIEKNYALFNLSENFFEKAIFLAKMWKDFLWIPKSEIIKMKALGDDAPWWKVISSQMQSPFLVSRVFAFELGWKLHILVMIRHHVELAQSFAGLFTNRHRGLKELLAVKGFKEENFFQLKNLLE